MFQPQTCIISDEDRQKIGDTLSCHVLNDCEYTNAVIVLSKGKTFTLHFSEKKYLKIGIDYIIEIIEKRLNVKNENRVLCKMIVEKLNTRLVFATTYGIAVDNLFVKNNDIIARIKEILDEKCIEYREEYSDALWNYRFIVSKSKANTEKINTIHA